MKYTDTHEWVSVSCAIGTVGITHYAQKELGEIVYVDLPKVGSQVKAGQEALVLESTKAAADSYAPVSGEVTAVNHNLSALNADPESSGWLYQVRLTNLAELEPLLDYPAYLQLIS